jgi:hypothetical protein
MVPDEDFGALSTPIILNPNLFNLLHNLFAISSLYENFLA